MMLRLWYGMTVLRIVTLALIVVLCCFPVSSLTGLHGWCYSCRSCQVCPILMLRAAPNMFADQVQPFWFLCIFTLQNPSIQTRQKNCLRPKIPTRCGRRNGMVNIVSLDLVVATGLLGYPFNHGWLEASNVCPLRLVSSEHPWCISMPSQSLGPGLKWCGLKNTLKR